MERDWLCFEMKRELKIEKEEGEIERSALLLLMLHSAKWQSPM
jgi:hypothetical protein